MCSESDLERAKGVMLNILMTFDAICKKHELTYWLDYGTLLGAVRHKGFIPWDDDIDVSMPREDYNKLLPIVQSELPESMFFQTIETDPEFRNKIARIRDRNSIMHVDYYKGKYSGIFVDVFPVDTVKSKYKFLVNPMKFYNGIDPFKPRYASTFRRVVHYILSPLLILKPLMEFIQKKIMLDKNGELYTLGLDINEHGMYLKKHFDELISIEFEGMHYPAPAGYDGLLIEMYGDYMKLPPKHQQVPSHHNEITFL